MSTFSGEDHREQASKTRVYEVLGTPALDPYTQNNRKAIKSIKKILFLTFEDNFYARLDRFAWQEKYFAEILPIFNELTVLGIEVFYKPHFENRAYHDYLFNYFGVDTTNIHYIEDQSFSKLIVDMDLTVCNVSTCFYESMAAGVPAIFLEPNFNPEALLPPLNSLNSEVILRVSTGAELLRLIRENHENAEKLALFLENFLAKHASVYMGKNDGKASLRVLEYLGAIG